MGGTDILNNYIEFVRRERREPVKYSNPTENQLEEQSIRHKWNNCKACKIYKKYRGILLSEIPSDEREIVKTIRDLWIEIDGQNVADDVIAFVKKYKREPRSLIFGRGYSRKELTPEEIEEIKLGERWERSFDKEVLDRMVGVEYEDIPHGYKGYVKKLRAHDLGYPESLNTRLYIRYIREHGFRPRQHITKNGKLLSCSQQSEEELLETSIRKRWDFSDDKKIYDKYKEGWLDEDTYDVYKDMIIALDEVNEINDENRAKLSEQRKAAWKEKLKRTRQAQSAEKKAQKEKDKKQKVKEEEALRREKLKERNKERKRKAKAQEKAKAESKARDAITKAEQKAIKQEIKAQQEAEATRARIQERNRRKEERIEEKKAAKEQAKIDNKPFYVQVAFIFIEFIKTKNRLPRFCIRDDNGNDIKVADLTESQKREKLLRKTWDESGFIDTINAYTGTPIEEVPEEYREVVAMFRSEGFGLTSDEYAKFRATRPAAQVLRCVRTARDVAASKRAKAKELEDSILEQLRARGKEQDDE